MMWNGFEGMGWGWTGLGAAHMLLFWGLVILGVVVLARWLAGSRDTQPNAAEILRARYAKGEISRAQFEQMKREIAQSP